MIARTTTMSVTFAKPFVLGDRDEEQPPGTYVVETDEEVLEGLSFLAYRRVQTVLRLPAIAGRSAYARMLVIHPDELEAALKRDRSGDPARATAPESVASEGASPEGAAGRRSDNGPI